MIYAEESEQSTRNVPTSLAERSAYVLTDAEILQLARSACTIERHYRGPMDIEWAKDGRSGQLFVVQARPETVQSRAQAGVQRTYKIVQKGRKLVSGLSIGGSCCFWPGLHHSRSQEYRSLRLRRGAGDNHHQSRLGADHETRGSHRHRSRRAHVPCSHRQPGAWSSGDRRHRAMPPRYFNRSNT